MVHPCVPIARSRRVLTVTSLTGGQNQRRTDEALMAQVQSGDTESFAVLYDRYEALALSVARSVCRDPGRAEEAVQEGFLTIWRSRDQYRPERGSFKSWSMKIVRNRSVDLMRRPSSRPSLGLDEHVSRSTSGSGHPLDYAVAQSERGAVLRLLRQLPSKRAEVIVLAYFGELSQPEIASSLAVPLGTVKGRMRLGMEKLRGGMSVFAD